MYTIRITLFVEMQRKWPIILTTQSISSLVSRNRLDYNMLVTQDNTYYDQNNQACMHSFSAYFECFIITSIS